MMRPNEYAFDFTGEQRALYERFREELRGLPWETIRGVIRETGEHRLGPTRDLQPVYPADPLPGSVSRQQFEAAWFCALLQVALQEQRLSLSHRRDPETGEDVLWVSAPFGAAWRTDRRGWKRSTRHLRQSR